MIVNFFKKSKPSHVAAVILLFFVFYISAVLLDDVKEVSLLFILKNIVFLLLFVFLLLYVNFIIKKNKLTKDNAYGLLIFVFLLGMFPKTMFSTAFLFANLFLLFGFRKIYGLKNGHAIKQKIFDAGLWIGVATLFYAWSGLFLLLVYLSIIIYRKIYLRNLLIPIIGFSVPVFLYFTWMFYNNDLPGFYNRFTLEYHLFFQLYHPLKLLIPITVLLTLLIWCVIFITPKIILISDKTKANWEVILNHLIISLAIVFCAPIKDGTEFLFLMFPSAIIITVFLQKDKSAIFKNLVLYLLLITAVTIKFL